MDIPATLAIDNDRILPVPRIRNISLLFHILIPRAGIVFRTADVVEVTVPVRQRICMIV